MAINKSIYKEYDIRGKYPEEIDDQASYALGLAFAKLIKGKKVAVGRDARQESEAVFWPLITGMAAGGLKIYDLGVCATPELFFAVGAKKLYGGVMVTASHSPQGQTGFKFCDSQGRVLGLNTGLKKMSVLADKAYGSAPARLNFLAQKKNVDFLTIAAEYKKFALSFVSPKNLSGYKLVIDASNGSGGRMAEVIFNSLPLKFHPLNFRPGGKSPQHGPNPLLAENRLAAAKLVRSKKADLGVIFDGDADRAIFIDERGQFVEPYYINCLLAQIILAENKRATIVIDARLNLAIAATIKKNGGKILVQRSGYANFIKTMTDKKLLFGCENSGHFIYNFRLKNRRQFVFGDAVISVLLILDYLKRHKLRLSESIKPYSSAYAISGELNFAADNFDQIGESLQKMFTDAEFSSRDGLSAIAPDKSWFFNIRPSHTEPVVRLNVEAVDRKTLELIKDLIVKTIKP